MTGQGSSLSGVDRGWAWTTGDDQAAAEVLVRHRRVFTDLSSSASALRATGRLEEAAGMAVAAAECAWLEHGGAFTHLGLESLLRDIGETITPSAAGSFTVGGDVLHVLTSAYPTGGHTRLVARWIEADAARRHTVVLTAQAGLPVPSTLRTAVERSRGRLSILDADRPGFRELGGRLRQLATNHDIVVLHTHPSDVLPVLAFAPEIGRLCVVTLNHADHVFWLGMTISHAVACLRPVGAELSTRRRGLEPFRAADLPVPVPEPPVAEERRAAARQALGIPNDAMLLISAAASYKYDAEYGGPNFATVLSDACLAIPRLRVGAIGPSPTGEWLHAQERTGGRLRALGVRQDLDALRAAADVYVDSFPLGSSTAALEAAAAGLPVLSLPVWHRHFPLATAHSSALDGVMVTAQDRGTLIGLLADLSTDPAAARALGTRTRSAILGWHGGQVWKDHLEALYSRAATLSESSPAPVDVAASTEVCDLILSRLPTGRWGGVGSEVSKLPTSPRLMAALRYLRAGGNRRPGLLTLLISYPALRDMKRITTRR